MQRAVYEVHSSFLKIDIAESTMKDVENDRKICYYEIYAIEEEINYEFIG